MTCVPTRTDLFPACANLCAMKTYALQRKNTLTYYWVPFNMAISIYKGGLNKIIQANIK